MPSPLSSLSLASLPVVVALGLSTGSVAVAQEAVESIVPEPGSRGEPVAQSGGSPGPGSDASPGPGPDASPGTIDLAGTWMATAFDASGAGLVEPDQPSRMTVSFLPDARLEGTTACGGYIGSWSARGESLRIGILTTGTSPCAQAPRDEEIAFTQALTAVTSLLSTTSGLELLDGSGAVRVRLEPSRDASLLGDWIVRRYARSDGRIREPLDGAELSVAFRPGELVDGSTGCRFFEGTYFTDGDRVAIGPLEEVGLPCEGAFRRQERRFLRALGDAVTWRRERSDLSLLDGAGRPVVELVERPA